MRGGGEVVIAVEMSLRAAARRRGRAFLCLGISHLVLVSTCEVRADQLVAV